MYQTVTLLYFNALKNGAIEVLRRAFSLSKFDPPPPTGYAYGVGPYGFVLLK